MICAIVKNSNTAMPWGKRAQAPIILVLSFFLVTTTEAVPFGYRVLEQTFSTIGDPAVRSCPPGRGEMVECVNGAGSLLNNGGYRAEFHAFTTLSGLLPVGTSKIDLETGIGFVIRLELTGDRGASKPVPIRARMSGNLAASGSSFVEARAGSDFLVDAAMSGSQVAAIGLLNRHDLVKSTGTRTNQDVNKVSDPFSFIITVGDVLTFSGALSVSSVLERIQPSNLALGGTATADFDKTFFLDIDTLDLNIVPISSSLFLLLIGLLGITISRKDW